MALGYVPIHLLSLSSPVTFSFVFVLFGSPLMAGLRSKSLGSSSTCAIIHYLCVCVCVLCIRTMTVMLPQVPAGFSSLAHWLSVMTDTTLKELLKQGDSQRVRELSLALITVLNGVRLFL